MAQLPRIGTAVRLRGTTRLGRIIKVSRWLRRPGKWPVKFNGETSWQNVDIQKLELANLARLKGEK